MEDAVFQTGEAFQHHASAEGVTLHGLYGKALKLGGIKG
jgi:hypothetical protein